MGHILLGYVLTFPFMPRLYGMAILGLGILLIILRNNRNDLALQFSSYYVGAEVFLRMTGGALSFEIGKYAVFLFLFLGGWNGKNTNKPNVLFVFYILLLLIGVLFTSLPEGESIRNQVIFNLSGPFLLGICALYFYRREVSTDAIFNVLKLFLYPIVSMCVYLYFRTPNLDEIVFGGVANYATSGGFGPNQVATALGLGIFCSAALLFARREFTGYIAFDIAILFYIMYRGLITFSRGGIMAAFIALSAFVVLYSLWSKMGFKFYFKIFALGIALSAGVWFYTSSATGGMLQNRYSGKNAAGIQKEDITSGRFDILNEQLNNFYESPILGIGVGNGKYKRLEGIKKVTAASHNEIGRLIEEHGLVGVFSLLLLFVSPVVLFLKTDFLQKAFLISFFLFWLLTISHSAMRIALPSLAYGLSLINIKYSDE